MLEININDATCHDLVCDLLVTDYREGSWDGEGEALSYSRSDNLVREYNLGHCSCFGPLDDPCMSSYPAEDFLSDATLGTNNVALDAAFTIELKKLMEASDA